jgi:hypothetical protein
MKTATFMTFGIPLSTLFFGCATQRNPFEDQVPLRQIEEVQALALNTVFESHSPPKLVFPEVATPETICLGVGQRGVRLNSQWLNQNPRETFWDPSAFLRSRLVDPPASILALSQCLRDGNDREMTAETRKPVVTYFVSDPTWATPNSAGLTVSIRGMGRYTMVYSLALRRRQGDWYVRRFSCIWARSQCDHFK